MSSRYIAAVYIIVINVITFFVFGKDKYAAKKDKWRISEATLFLITFLGGGIGAMLGMKFLHHKTKKFKFAFGIPFITFIECVLLVYLVFLR